MRNRCRLRKIPIGEEGEEDGAATFNDEEVAPVGDGAAVDLEDAESEKAGKGRGDGLGGVEESEASGEFTSTVESGLHAHTLATRLL